MRITRFISASVVALVLLFTTASAQNAGSTWNQYASSYGFGTYLQMPGTTFEEAYSGSNFTADFAALLAAVAQALNTRVPDVGGEDLVNATLENWPPTGSGT